MNRRVPTSRAARGRWSRDDEPLAVFVRGATVGAFVGAMIAGSAVWHRVLLRVAAGRAVSSAAPADTSAVAGPPVRGGVEGRGR